MNVHIFLAFLAYFCILLCVGVLAYKKQTSAADFIVGNRSLNFWVIALSAQASDMSSWLFMAFPAAIMIRGLPQIWIAIGLLAGMYFNWQFVAKRLRTMTEQYDCYTLSSLFEKRFQDKSGTIRTITAIMSIFFLTCYLSAGLISMGMILESVFHINYYLGLSIAMVVVVLYTFTGGFITVAWTDLFQAIFLLGVVIIVPLTTMTYLPQGAASIVPAAAAQHISLSIMEDYSKESIFTVLFLVFGWGLGYFGQPHIVTKFLGIKSPDELTKSKYVGMTWMITALSAAALIGLVGIPFFQGNLQKPELIFIEIVKTLFNPFIGGFVLCGVIAATMSTMDSQILVCASVFSEDLYQPLFRKEASQKEILLVSKVGVVVISLLSLMVAFLKSSTILVMVQYAWSGLGCSFGPLVLMSLYSQKTNKYGAIAGILTGGLIAALWDQVNPYITDYTIPSMIPGFILGLAAVYAGSRLTQMNSCCKGWTKQNGQDSYTAAGNDKNRMARIRQDIQDS